MNRNFLGTQLSLLGSDPLFSLISTMTITSPISLVFHVQTALAKTLRSFFPSIIRYEIKYLPNFMRFLVKRSWVEQKREAGKKENINSKLLSWSIQLIAKCRNFHRSREWLCMKSCAGLIMKNFIYVVFVCCCISLVRLFYKLFMDSRFECTKYN